MFGYVLGMFKLTPRDNGRVNRRRVVFVCVNGVLPGAGNGELTLLTLPLLTPGTHPLLVYSPFSC